MPYAIFDTPAIHGIPGIKELAQAGREMVPPLVIATAQLLQVLDDSPVNIALPSIQDELVVTEDRTPDGMQHLLAGASWDHDGCATTWATTVVDHLVAMSFGRVSSHRSRVHVNRRC